MIPDKYYDIPYLQGGRSLAGCDCFGLLRLWYQHELGIILPDYGGAESIEGLHLLFRRVEPGDVRRHDVLSMAYAGQPHCGVVAGEDRFIHSMDKVGVAVSKINTWGRQIKGAYRYADKTHS